MPGPPSTSWRTGHLGNLYNPYGMSWHHQLNQKYGGAVQINGIMGDEHIYVSDPKALHHICVRDQDNFEETAMFVQGNQIIFGDGLLSTLGDHHKKQRRILNPIFSTSHMRDMTPIFYEVVDKLVGLINKKTSTGPAKMDILDLMMRTALEGVGQGGLGHSFKTLEEGDGNSPFRIALRSLIPTIFSLQIERQILPFILGIGTKAFRRKLVDMTPSRRLHKLRDIVNTMHVTNTEVLEEKKAAFNRGDEKVLEQVGHGRDIVSVLLRALEDVSDEDRLSDSEVLAHMTTLVFASHDTTSSTLAHIVHLLAIYPEVQEKLRKEIKDSKDAWEREHETGDRNLGYDRVSELPFLEAVCRETLRLEAPVTFMSRTAREPSVLPLWHPMTGSDGKTITEVPIAKNQNIIIGIAAADRDPEIWGPDAAEWKPERWANGIPKLAADAHLPGIYAGTMAFLGGGRGCIGIKFAQLEIKIIITMLLDNFKFSLSEDEVVWKLANIQMPWVEKTAANGPSLPLMISRLA
ncbi:cytochrome P450 [Athelia psychrophila]|uniref:Cytochrome P450 n=1 Tax=Athelia psychrophila TaxID=1759441 RepID=A0A166FDS8_9AGAM|nr:cytochrome P450 [Fibularhizoctonia sp. CBS 109695]